MPVPWSWQLLCSSLLLFQNAEACFDSSGDFYCTTLWYFWFSLFWLFMFLFVGVVCIVNRCSKEEPTGGYTDTVAPANCTQRSRKGRQVC